MNQQPHEDSTTSDPLTLSTSQISFGRIVVGYDPAEGREDIIRVADVLARELDSELLIVNALAPVPSMLGVVGQAPEAIPARMDEIRSSLETDLRRRGISASFKVLVDRDAPVNALVVTTRKYGADLLVVGTHGRYGIGQFLLGSVSQSLIGRVDCPVLILGPQFEPRSNLFQTILFASDLEKANHGPAKYAVQLATQFCGDVLLLHVIGDKPHSEGRMREWVEDNEAHKLNGLVSPDLLGECNHRALIAYGDPAQEILAAADRHRADLIVLGARKPRLWNDHASWSVLTEVLRHARCPVLVVSS